MIKSEDGIKDDIDGKITATKSVSKGTPTPAQKSYLTAGLKQAGGKLPLFDNQGQLINSKTIQACVAKGWAQPWFNNPLKPDWLVCKLTQAGREAVT